MNKIYFRSIIAFWLGLGLLSCQGTLVPTARLAPETGIKVNASLPAHPQTEALIAPYRQQLQAQMTEVLGYSAQELRKIDNRESALGNFVADVQMAQVLPLYPKPIDLSLMTTGGLRATIPQGPVTLNHVFELSPFENQLVVVTLPGTTLQKLFAYGARSKDLIFNNATFTIKNNQPLNIRINHQPLDVNRLYRVVMSDYLANGGDNLTFLKEATSVEPTGILVREALIRHIRQLTAQNKKIEARIDGRMIIQEPDQKM